MSPSCSFFMLTNLENRLSITKNRIDLLDNFSESSALEKQYI